MMRKFLLSLMLIVLVTGCRKNDPPDPCTPGPLYLIPQEFREWTVFQEGSYWIYRNHQTQAVDCTWYKHGPYYELEPQCYLPQFEKIWFFVNSPFLVRFDLKGGKDSNATIIVATRGGYGGLMGLTYRTVIDPAHADSLYNREEYRCLGSYDSLVVNGKVFYQVRHTSMLIEPYYGDPVYWEFMFSRNTGLIWLQKGEAGKDTTWSLVRWHTQQ